MVTDITVKLKSLIIGVLITRLASKALQPCPSKITGTKIANVMFW